MKRFVSAITSQLSSIFHSGGTASVESPASTQTRVVSHFEKRVARIIHQETGFTSHLTISKTHQVYFKVKNARGLLIGLALIKPETSEMLIPKNYIREVAAMRDKYNLPLAYVATLGYFNKEATVLAQKLNVRLITRNNFIEGESSGIVMPPVRLEPQRQVIYGDNHTRFMPPHLRKARHGRADYQPIEADIPILEGRNVPLHEIPLDEQRMIRVLPEREYQRNLERKDE